MKSGAYKNTMQRKGTFFSVILPSNGRPDSIVCTQWVQSREVNLFFPTVRGIFIFTTFNWTSLAFKQDKLYHNLCTKA